MWCRILNVMNYVSNERCKEAMRSEILNVAESQAEFEV